MQEDKSNKYKIDDNLKMTQVNRGAIPFLRVSDDEY
jgi:hypothetical protein